MHRELKLIKYMNIRLTTRKRFSFLPLYSRVKAYEESNHKLITFASNRAHSNCDCSPRKQAACQCVHTASRTLNSVARSESPLSGSTVFNTRNFSGSSRTGNSVLPHVTNSIRASWINMYCACLKKKCHAWSR